MHVFETDKLFVSLYRTSLDTILGRDSEQIFWAISYLVTI